MIRSTALVVAAALVLAPAAITAASSEPLVLNGGGSTLLMDIPAGWVVDANPRSQAPCLVQQTDCAAIAGIALVPASPGTGTHEQDTRIVANLLQGALRDISMRTFIDRQKQCAWPYSTHTTNLRCVSLEWHLSASVHSVEHPAIDAGGVKVALLEFRRMADSTPAWTAAYVPLGNDILQIRFRADSEQRYNEEIAGFRGMLASFRTQATPRGQP